MPNTFSRTGDFLHITFANPPVNWDSRTESDEAGKIDGGCFIQTVQFKGAAAGAPIQVRTVGVTGTPILTAADGDGNGKSFNLNANSRSFPAIAAADVTAGLVVNINFKLNPDSKDEL